MSFRSGSFADRHRVHVNLPKPLIPFGVGLLPSSFNDSLCDKVGSALECLVAKLKFNLYLITATGYGLDSPGIES